MSRTLPVLAVVPGSAGVDDRAVYRGECGRPLEQDLRVREAKGRAAQARRLQIAGVVRLKPALTVPLLPIDFDGHAILDNEVFRLRPSRASVACG